MNTQVETAPQRGRMETVALASSVAAFLLYAGFFIWARTMGPQVSHHVVDTGALNGGTVIFLVSFVTGLVTGILRRGTDFGRKALYVSAATVAGFVIPAILTVLLHR